jgi:hypothetical protein
MLWEGHRRADQGRHAIVLAALELAGIGEDEPLWPALIAADNSGVSAPRRRTKFDFCCDCPTLNRFTGGLMRCPHGHAASRHELPWKNGV